MNKVVISLLTLGACLIPVQALSAEGANNSERSAVVQSAGHKHRGHQDWQQHREHRRDTIPHRHGYNHRVIKTDHQAIKKRVAAYHKKHPHQHRQRSVYPKEITIHYYGANSAHPYDRHRRHYLNHLRHRHSHRHSHQNDTDYLEWLTLMALLDNIYSDRH